jgi:hypothetical protein
VRRGAARRPFPSGSAGTRAFQVAKGSARGQDCGIGIGDRDRVVDPSGRERGVSVLVVEDDKLADCVAVAVPETLQDLGVARRNLILGLELQEIGERPQYKRELIAAIGAVNG